MTILSRSCLLRLAAPHPFPICRTSVINLMLLTAYLIPVHRQVFTPLSVIESSISPLGKSAFESFLWYRLGKFDLFQFCPSPRMLLHTDHSNLHLGEFSSLIMRAMYRLSLHVLSSRSFTTSPLPRSIINHDAFMRDSFFFHDVHAIPFRCSSQYLCNKPREDGFVCSYRGSARM